jgi:hypothetical protein
MKFVNWNGKKDYDPCELYNWRLDWLENQIKIHRTNGRKIPESQYERWFDEEEKVYKNNLRDYEKIKKLDKPIGVIVPTHKYHNVWLKSCLKSCHKTNYWILLAYDNPYYNSSHKHSDLLPSVETLMYADQILMKPKTWGSGVGIPHSWNMFLGLKTLKSLGFKYVFNINGDCIMEKPEGVDKLFKMLGDADIISCEYHKDKYLGTMAWLAKMDVALKMWEMNMEKLYQQNFGNAEARMGIFSKQLNLKVISVINPSDHHFKDWNHTNTFREILGIRHLHAEHKVRRWEKKEPIEEKYFDKTFLNSHEQKTLLKYWKTGNKQFLQQWWK